MKKNVAFHEHTDILRASYKLNPNSLKILGYCLNKLKYQDSNIISIPKKELFSIIPDFKNKDRLTKAMESLKTQTIKNFDKELLFSVWISAVVEKENIYMFEFPILLLEKLKTFISKEMVNINLYEYFKLTKYSSLRLYKILSQYINTTQLCIMKESELKEILILNNKDDRNNVREIENSCKEISEKTDIIVYKSIQKNSDGTKKVIFNIQKKIISSIDNEHIFEQQENIISSDKKEEIKIESMKESEPVQIIKKTPQKQSENIEEYKVWFEKIWSLYPNKKGKTTVQRKAKTLYSEKEKVEIALNNYLRDKDLKINGGFKSLKDASTFFNQYKDFLVIEKNENISSDKKTKNWGY